MAPVSRVSPPLLAHELKVVVRAACRPARLITHLHQVRGLLTACDPAGSSGDAWTQAIGVCRVTEEAGQRLGDGPYGEATRLLLGTHSKTRGLLLGRRRLAAADELQVEVTTFIRHWESAILLDLGVILYERLLEHRM